MMNDVGNNTLNYILVQDGAKFIQVCYRELLGREADSAGLQHHLDILARGRSKLNMVVDLANSPESQSKGFHDSPVAIAARRRWQSRWRLPKIGKRKSSLATRAEAIGSATSEAVVHARPYRVELVPVNDWSKTILEGEPFGQRGINNFWFDLTTSLQWTSGVVGIIRAELEMARNLKKICPALRFSMQVNHGLAEIESSALDWLLDAENVAEAYMDYFGRSGGRAHSVNVNIPDTDDFFHPYAENDLIFSMGWKDSKKEQLFSIVKSLIPSLSLAYTIYDIIMLRPETKHFYGAKDQLDFEKYLKWISYNCDFLLFGGENTKRDVQEWQGSRGWPSPPGRAIRWGSDIVQTETEIGDDEHLENLGIQRPFMMAVGTVEPRKNYDTLYRAYVLAQGQLQTPLPQLVICGQNGHRVGNLSDVLARDPRVKDRVLRRTPTDQQLSALYRNCLFTLLPSFYEGWSLTLPESFSYGKFCLCADTPPLREIGGQMADYVDPVDVTAWAKKIVEYSSGDDSLKRQEDKIAAEWHMITWVDSAEMAFNLLLDLREDRRNSDAQFVRSEPDPTIWMDLSLSYLNWNHSLTGVTRVELMYAKMLRSLEPTARFFAYDQGSFFEIEPSYLSWMDDGADLSEAYDRFHAFWHGHEQSGTSFRSPFRTVDRPQDHPAYIEYFPTNSVIFCAGIDFGSYDDKGEPVLLYTDKIKRLIAPGAKVLLSHFMHDFTPSDWPHIHKAETVEGYEPFCDYVSNHFDYLVYGGETAFKDGVELQHRRGWRSPPGDPAMLGFDINSNVSREEGRDAKVLVKIGIKSDFLLAVGTLEPRKNHETLYRAFLLMQKRGLLERPVQMVFVGKRGWNNDDFLANLEADDRIKGKIITVNPNDEDLDVLYRNCLFTLLPSFYEGWSLPLPESLAYGKFCLVSDTPPLRERGADFVEYINPLDCSRWAERIAVYVNAPEKLIPWQERIKRQWKPCNWREATQMLIDLLYKAYGNEFVGGNGVEPGSHAPWHRVGKR